MPYLCSETRFSRDHQTTSVNALPLPKAVIVVEGALQDLPEIEAMIAEALKSGAVHISLTGQAAGAIEDAVDWLCVGTNRLEVTTTSHSGESLAEITEFVVMTMGMRAKAFSVLLIGGAEQASTMTMDASLKNAAALFSASAT